MENDISFDNLKNFNADGHTHVKKSKRDVIQINKYSFLSKCCDSEKIGNVMLKFFSEIDEDLINEHDVCKEILNTMTQEEIIETLENLCIFKNKKRNKQNGSITVEYYLPITFVQKFKIVEDNSINLNKITKTQFVTVNGKKYDPLFSYCCVNDNHNSMKFKKYTKIILKEKKFDPSTKIQNICCKYTHQKTTPNNQNNIYNGKTIFRYDPYDWKYNKTVKIPMYSEIINDVVTGDTILIKLNQPTKLKYIETVGSLFELKPEPKFDECNHKPHQGIYVKDDVNYTYTWATHYNLYCKINGKLQFIKLFAANSNEYEFVGNEIKNFSGCESDNMEVTEIVIEPMSFFPTFSIGFNIYGILNEDHLTFSDKICYSVLIEKHSNHTYPISMPRGCRCSRCIPVKNRAVRKNNIKNIIDQEIKEYYDDNNDNNDNNDNI